MTDLAELLERVKAATGADRELDDAVCMACGYSRGPGPGAAYRHGPYWYEPGGKLYGEVSPQVTASLDAALALVERVLPGAKVLMGQGQTPDTKPWARVGKWLVMDGADATAASLPLALLAALLAATIAEPASGDVGSVYPESAP